MSDINNLGSFSSIDAVWARYPEGGKEGGRIVATGTPEELVKIGTHTGKALAPVLARV